MIKIGDRVRINGLKKGLPKEYYNFVGKIGTLIHITECDLQWHKVLFDGIRKLDFLPGELIKVDCLAYNAKNEPDMES